MTKVIVIDPGHGGSDPGAQGNGLREKDLTLDISKRIRKYLENNYSSLKVLMTRTGDKYLTLSQRAKFANDRNADLFVSIHINAGGGTGYESFIHTSNSSGSRNAQNSIHSEAIKGMKVRDRGKKRANFAVLRQTKMPAILPENLFIDRKEDAEKLKNSKFLDKIAEGHAIGIAKSLGLKSKTGGKVTSKPTKKTTNKTATSHTKVTKKPSNDLGLVDWMKSQRMDSSFGNRKKLAAQYGIRNYRGTASQNTALLTNLKAGKPKPTAKGNQKTDSIVSYLDSVNIDSSYGNRARLAKANGISNYKGTAAQNTRLLNILRGGSSKPKNNPNIKQLADKVINSSSAPTGNEARRKWLGVSKATYDKVRAEINRRYS